MLDHQTTPCRHRRAPSNRPRRTRNHKVCRAAGDADGGSVSPLRGIVYSSAGARAPTPPAFPLTAPLLPFMADEVLLPGCTKTLHLYEARFLALLEEVLATEHKLFG
jgi:hypothetical protein